MSLKAEKDSVAQRGAASQEGGRPPTYFRPESRISWPVHTRPRGCPGWLQHGRAGLSSHGGCHASQAHHGSSPGTSMGAQPE